MNLFKWLVCLFRNYHRFSVADMAMFSEMGSYPFRGTCSDCGARVTRNGREWKQTKGSP